MSAGTFDSDRDHQTLDSYLTRTVLYCCLLSASTSLCQHLSEPRSFPFKNWKNKMRSKCFLIRLVCTRFHFWSAASDTFSIFGYNRYILVVKATEILILTTRKPKQIHSISTFSNFCSIAAEAIYDSLKCISKISLKFFWFCFEN